MIEVKPKPHKDLISIQHLCKVAISIVNDSSVGLVGNSMGILPINVGIYNHYRFKPGFEAHDFKLSNGKTLTIIPKCKALVIK